MLRRIGADELAEWIEFYRLESFGEDRADLRMARVCQAVAASTGWKTTLGQWLLFATERAGQSTAQILMAAKALGSWFRGNRRNS